MIIAWRAWFVGVPHQEDLIRYCSTDIDYENLPRDGCLGMVLFEHEVKPDGKHKRGILNGYDYYFKSGDIYGVDLDSRERKTVEDIKARYVEPVIIRGIWTSDDMMKSMQEEMRASQWP